MHGIFTIAIKGLAGGCLVLAFALVSEALTPKRFAGLFSAAPSVALAGLTVTLLTKGHREAHRDTVGMIAGAAGMIAYAAAVVPLLRRRRAVSAAGIALVAWCAAAALAALPAFLA